MNEKAYKLSCEAKTLSFLGLSYFDVIQKNRRQIA